MKAINTLILFSCFSSSIFALELDYLYNKNIVSPITDKEKQIVNHVKLSYEKALNLQSKLSGKDFTAGNGYRIPGACTFNLLKDITARPYYHLLNNLCELKNASHLHVGLLAGDSYIAALYGNQLCLNQQIGLDWFQECPRNTFIENCKHHIDLNKCIILNEECFNLDKSIFKAPVDIYLYDADHSLIAHEKAITYYNEVFADIFVVVLDDWECPWIRKPSFKAFEKLGYKILYQEYIPGTAPYSDGQYIAVIKK